MLKLYQDYTVNKGMDKKLFCATYLAFTSTINTYLFILEFFHLSCCRTTLSQWTLCLWARLVSRIGCGRGGTSPSSNSTNRAAAGASAATSSAAAGRRAVASPAAAHSRRHAAATGTLNYCSGYQKMIFILQMRSF